MIRVNCGLATESGWDEHGRTRVVFESFIRKLQRTRTSCSGKKGCGPVSLHTVISGSDVPILHSFPQKFARFGFMKTTMGTGEAQGLWLFLPFF